MQKMSNHRLILVKPVGGWIGIKIHSFQSSLRHSFYLFEKKHIKDLRHLLQIKMASVKLTMKYLKRVSAELEEVSGPEEEELMLRGVRFAFRVHQVISSLGYMQCSTKSLLGPTSIQWWCLMHLFCTNIYNIHKCIYFAVRILHVTMEFDSLLYDPNYWVGCTILRISCNCALH